MSALQFEIVKNVLFRSLTPIFHQAKRDKFLRVPIPRLRHPIWYVPKTRTRYEEGVTSENEAFVREQVHAKYGQPAVVAGVPTLVQSSSVLKEQPFVRGEWRPGTKRVGLVARKIGIYPMWTKDGTKVLTTLLHVVDNHVIKYIPPEEFHPPRPAVRRRKMEGKLGCILVGAETGDPTKFTKDYCGLFASSGMAPKKILSRFLVTPEAAIQPGTPLFANHFNIGDYVDVLGFTTYRGFQGVMKRHGFSGMPASHGVTKTHRRPGNIGAGGEKSRVWPGTKMPGHMGNRARVQRGLQILRINTKYNVIWVKGNAVAGATNSVCRIMDTLLPLKWLKESPPFPTFYPEDLKDELPEDIFLENIHAFGDPTITYEPEKVAPKK